MKCSHSLQVNVPGAHTYGLIKTIHLFTVQCVMLLYIQRTPWTTLFWTSWVHFCVETLIDTNYRPCCSSGRESACNGRDLSGIPGLGRSTGEGKGYPLQCSGLENFIDCIGVAKSQTWLSEFHFHFSQYHTIVAGWIFGWDIIKQDWLKFKKNFYSRVKARSGAPNFTLFKC